MFVDCDDWQPSRGEPLDEDLERRIEEERDEEGREEARQNAIWDRPDKSEI